MLLIKILWVLLLPVLSLTASASPVSGVGAGRVIPSPESEVMVGERVALRESVLAECRGDSVRAMEISKALPVKGRYGNSAVRNAERFYNRWDVRWWAVRSCALVWICFFRGYRGRWLYGLPALALAAAFILEWILSDSVPLSGAGPMLNALSLVLSLVFFLNGGRLSVKRAAPLALPVLTCLCVAGALSWHHPAVRAVNPALVSPWLPVHVALMAAAYGCLLSGSVAVLATGLTGRGSAWIAVGVGLLACGIAAGSLWASSAWGRWWSWDPKEDFALATLLLWGGVWIWSRKASGPRGVRIAVASALVLTVGIWFLTKTLGGLHSY